MLRPNCERRFVTETAISKEREFSQGWSCCHTMSLEMDEEKKEKEIEEEKKEEKENNEEKCYD